MTSEIIIIIIGVPYNGHTANHLEPLVTLLRLSSTTLFGFSFDSHVKEVLFIEAYYTLFFIYIYIVS